MGQQADGKPLVVTVSDWLKRLLFIACPTVVQVKDLSLHSQREVSPKYP